MATGTTLKQLETEVEGLFTKANAGVISPEEVQEAYDQLMTQLKAMRPAGGGGRGTPWAALSEEAKEKRRAYNTDRNAKINAGKAFVDTDDSKLTPEQRVLKAEYIKVRDRRVAYNRVRNGTGVPEDQLTDAQLKVREKRKEYHTERNAAIKGIRERLAQLEKLGAGAAAS